MFSIAFSGQEQYAGDVVGGIVEVEVEDDVDVGQASQQLAIATGQAVGCEVAVMGILLHEVYVDDPGVNGQGGMGDAVAPRGQLQYLVVGVGVGLGVRVVGG